MQEDLQDDEIRAQELSAKRAKLSADRMTVTGILSLPTQHSSQHILSPKPFG